MSSYYEKILATGEVKCIDEEITFEIPKGWEWCRLSAVSCSIVDGDHMPPPKSFQGIPFIVISNIAMGYLDLNTSRYVPESYFCTLSQERVPQVGDILFSVTGSYGIAVRINTNCNFCFQRHIALIRPMSINSEYLEFLLNSAFIKNQCDTVATGMAQKTVGIDSLRKLIIPIPPIREQSSIVAKSKLLMPLVRKYSIMQKKLDRLDANIKKRLYNSILQDAIKGWPTCPMLYKFCHSDSSDNAIVLLEQIKTEKQKLVKEGKLKKSALNGSVIFRGDDNKYYIINKKEKICIDDEIPFDIPDTWEWCRLGTLFSHCTGKALNASNLKGQLMTYITTSNLYWDRFELGNLKQMRFTDEEIEKCTATFGDLLVCEGGDIGRAAIWNYPYDIRIQNHIHKLRAYKQLCTKFFFWVFYFYKATGRIGGKGIGIQGLSSKALDNILIPLPPLKEQQRIVAQIEKLFEQLH